MADDPLDDRIAELEAELVALKRARADREDVAFLLTLARVIPAGVVFSVGELVAHSALDRELAAALGAQPPKVLGKRLARLARRELVAGVALACLGRDESGCMWTVCVTG